MHKSRLHELCHKQMWALPEYTSRREGPDHNPLFGASVIINDRAFDAPNLFKSLKEAHNKAAEIALEHLLAIPSAAPIHSTCNAPTPATSESPVTFSTLYLRKKGFVTFGLVIASCMKDFLYSTFL